MAKEIVYIIYEKNTHHEMRLTGIFRTLEHAKLYLKRRARSWTNNKTDLEKALADIDKVTDAELLNDKNFWLQLDDLGVTYYLYREPVL